MTDQKDGKDNKEENPFLKFNKNEEQEKFLKENDKPLLSNDDNYFDDLSKTTLLKGKDFMIEANDDHDAAEDFQKKKTIKLIAFLTICVLAIAIGSFFAVKYVLSSKISNNSSVSPTASISTQAKKSSNPSHNSKNVILEKFNNAPIVEPEEQTVTVNKNSFDTENGSVLAIDNAQVNASQTACTVTNPTDFCYAGNISLNNNSSYVYYLKDAAHSRFFEGAKNTKMQSVTGASVAMSLTMDFGGQNMKALVIVAPDSSGYVVSIPSNVTDISSYAHNFSISMR